MKLTDYPEVVVEGAPGWSTFQGWLVATFPSVEGQKKVVVCAEFDGKIETNVFDMTYVTSL